MGFSDIVMPEWVRRGLYQAVTDHKLPHAYLFVGPAGVGKRTTAMALAKAVNCPFQAGDACDRCAVCQRIDRGVYPDLHLVAPQGQAIKIDQIRQLQAMLTLQAYEGRMKVALLDDAEKLTIEAANSLLKILEEPPAETLFILLCQNLGGLPATVTSRAQVLRFGLLPRDHIIALLRQRQRSPAEAEQVASLSGGRPGRAVALELPKTLELRAEALQLLTQAQRGDPAVLLGSAEHWAKRKGDYEGLFEMLLSLTRDLALVQAGGTEAALMHGDLRGALAPLVSSALEATLWEVFDLIHATQQAIAHNANPQLAIEVMLLRIGDAYERPRQRDRAGYDDSLA
jgi:DNA polymerase-3 subunit delta'